MQEIVVQTLEELGNFAKQFVEKHPQGAVVALSGELGAGKTTFVRFVVEVIAIKQRSPVPRVTSPSFVLHQAYPALCPPVEHFDLYRLESVGREALIEMGYFEALDRNRKSSGFLFVEWPEKVLHITLLQASIQLTLAIHSKGRTLTSRILKAKPLGVVG